jgi:electron transfer flavoprotein beta subunit
MKVLVAVKRVIDPYVRVRVAEDGTGVITKNAKMAMNPFDEIALEQAIRLKEAGLVSEIILVSIGEHAGQETLRKGLAMGADRAIHVETDATFQPIQIAHILKQIADEEKPMLALLGKQTIDGDHNQTGQMLAALLDWPQATFISELTLTATTATACREIDGGLETIEVDLPAVVTADLRLNEPRYASLPSIMKAKSKPLVTRSLSEFPAAQIEHIKVLAVSAPAERKPGVRVDSVEALMDKLKNEAQVI